MSSIQNHSYCIHIQFPQPTKQSAIVDKVLDKRLAFLKCLSEDASLFERKWLFFFIEILSMY